MKKLKDLGSIVTTGLFDNVLQVVSWYYSVYFHDFIKLENLRNYMTLEMSIAFVLDCSHNGDFGTCRDFLPH